MNMNSKRYFLALLSLFGIGCMQAQIDVDDEGMDGDDDEITVTEKEDHEEEVDFPEAMTFNLDSLLQLYHSRNYLEDGDCQMGNENPSFPTEVYIDRLRRLPTVMEMAHNEVVQAHIDRYTGRMRRSVSYMLGAANFYLPIFEDALDAYQLPLELKYLPIIESALKPTAVSRVGAAGLWQFMPSTGKKYGLTVNNYVDERRDPVKSSYAAAHLLSDLYKVFGDWNLVIAAYNCGPGNVNKAIHRARLAAGRGQDDAEMTKEDKDFWKIYPYLPRETRGYVPAFIAANYAMNYYCEHNICPMRTQLPPTVDTVMVDKNVDLRQIAAVLNIDIELLRALNPMYRRDLVPGLTAPSPINLLPSDAVRFIDQQDSIYSYNAKDYMTKRDVVEVTDAPAASSRNTGRVRGRGHTVTVRRGDTLGAIARRNGISLKQLKRLNGLKNDRLSIGQKLRVR